MENSMKFLKNIVFLALGVVLLGSLVIENKLKAASYYGLSCTNKAYGTQNASTSGLYIQAYSTLGSSDVTNDITDGTGITAYLGRGCLYSGAGLTNSAAIVSGDVARNAANAIVSAVTSRINVAMAQNADTASNMSYTANEYGVGMAANRVFGGLSLWTNYSDSDFDNDQTFTNVRTDSNKYDGDASSMSYGIDKKIGNVLIGITGSSFESDITTSANTGTYKADGETYGLYAGINTGVLNISAGFGVGEYDIDTTRLDLGTGNTTIRGSATADVEYMHLAANAMLNRGKFIIMPRIAYRELTLDTPAFVETVPNDSNAAGPTGDNTTGTDATGKNVDDVNVSAFDAESSMTEVGAQIALTLGAITPFIDASYVNEDTTTAAYKTELTTDAVNETAASDNSGYTSLGFGLSLNLKGRLTGNISYYSTYDRDDYNENTFSGSLRLQF
jgi:hypothetical protein